MQCAAPVALCNNAHVPAHFQVFLTSTHLAIVMEYASGGELFDRIVKIGRFSEDEARYFFQQLISGVDFCHQSVSKVVRGPYLECLSLCNR